MARRKRLEPLGEGELTAQRETSSPSPPPSADVGVERAFIWPIVQNEVAQQVLQECRQGRWHPVQAEDDDIFVADNGVAILVPRGQRRLVPERMLGYVEAQKQARREHRQALQAGPLWRPELGFGAARCALCRRPASMCTCVVS